MYCKNCGKEIAEGQVYCEECQPQEVEVVEEEKTVDPSKGKGIAALICGIASFFIFGLVLAIVAMVLGGQAANTAGAKFGKIGKTLGLVSLILSILAVVAVGALLIFYVIFVVLIGGAAMEGLYYY